MLSEIKQFCTDKQLTWNRFGILAIGDGRVVAELERGRRLSDATQFRVTSFMQDNAETDFGPPTTHIHVSPGPSPKFNPNLTPYAGSDSFDEMIASGSRRLLVALDRFYAQRRAA